MLKVYDDKEVEDTDVYLKLVQYENGVRVVCVDKNDKRILYGALLCIKKEGVILYPGINPDLDGVDGKTRTIMSFAHYDDKTIATQAHDAIVANLPKDLQKEYCVCQ